MNLRIEHLAKTYGLKTQGHFDSFELILQGKLSTVRRFSQLRIKILSKEILFSGHQ